MAGCSTLPPHWQTNEGRSTTCSLAIVGIQPVLIITMMMKMILLCDNQFQITIIVQSLHFSAIEFCFFYYRSRVFPPFCLHKQLDAPPGRGKMLILCVNINVYGLPSAGCPFLSFTTSKSTVCHHWGPSRRIQYFPRRINWGWGWRGGAGKKRSGCHGWYEGNFR